MMFHLVLISFAWLSLKAAAVSRRLISSGILVSAFLLTALVEKFLDLAATSICFSGNA